MKYVLPLALLASGSSLVRADPRPIGDNDWFMLASQAGSGGPCQENNENGENAFCARTEDNQPGMTGTNVVMGTECPWDNMSGWRLWTAPDNDGFLLMLGDENGYSESPKALCMQAGDGDRQSRIRLRPCDMDHPLQRWVWKDYGDCGGPIKLQSNRDFCLTWQGAEEPSPNETRRMIIKECKDLGGARRQGWRAI